MPNAPEALDETDDLDEILRVWIVDGDLRLALHDFFGPDSQQWGWVLADLAMHIARFRFEDNRSSVEETLVAIETGYQQRMSDQHDLSHRSLVGRN